MTFHISASGRDFRSGGTLFLVAAVALTLAGCSSAASTPSGAGQVLPSQAASGAAREAPQSGTDVAAIAPAPGGVGAGAGGSGVGVATSGIAYPYPAYGGSPGVAPDHSILVTGTGQADLAVDGKNRAAAEHRALVLGVADAKSRAEAVATATGASIQGVLSVSVAVAQGWFGPVPMDSPGGPATPSTSGTVVPAPPATPQLTVTVTIAYTIG